LLFWVGKGLLGGLPVFAELRAERDCESGRAAIARKRPHLAPIGPINAAALSPTSPPPSRLSLSRSKLPRAAPTHNKRRASSATGFFHLHFNLMNVKYKLKSAKKSQFENLF